MLPHACPCTFPSLVSPGAGLSPGEQQDEGRAAQPAGVRWVRPGLRAGSGALSWGRHLKAPWPLSHFVLVKKKKIIAVFVKIIIVLVKSTPKCNVVVGLVARVSCPLCAAHLTILGQWESSVVLSPFKINKRLTGCWARDLI